MRIFVLGATGKTGSALVRLALKRGYAVTAFVRSPQKLSTAIAGLSVVTGTPADIPGMARAMADHDVVFSAIAPSIPDLLWRKRDWTMLSYAENILQAMQRAGLRRLLTFSSGALFPEQSLFIRIVDATLSRSHHADLRAMDAAITASTLDWTIARPGAMSLGEAPEYRAQTGAMVVDAKPMTFDGLASFLLDEAAEGGHVRQIVGVAR